MDKQFKIQMIKNANPEIYSLYETGKLSLQDAYNETKRIQLGLSEFRGSNSKKKHFAVDFKRIMALHNPSSEELIEEIKKAFPLTWKEFIKVKE